MRCEHCKRRISIGKPPCKLHRIGESNEYRNISRRALELKKTKLIKGVDGV